MEKIEDMGFASFLELYNLRVLSNFYIKYFVEIISKTNLNIKEIEVIFENIKKELFSKLDYALSQKDDNKN